MNKYNSSTIYTGSIVKCINGEKTVLKENVFLIYNQDEDNFCLLDALNYIVDLDLNQNLTEEQREEYKKIISENMYPYYDKDNNGQTYIDEESICIALSEEKYKKNTK